VAGDPTKTSMWPDADVYVADLDADLPDTVNDPFPAAWGLVGLLDGDAGVTESREEDTGDHYAWGGILVRTHRRQFKYTRSFTALEDNPVTRALLWPGSENGSLKVPRPQRKLVAFETRDPELNKVRRLISAFQAEIVVNGDVTESEAELTGVEYLATFFPTAAGVLLTEQGGELVPSP